MPKLPSKKDLKQLAKFNEPHCVTIYTPFIEWTGSTNPNKIMLKNLIRQAQLDLLATGLKENLVDKTLRPVRALLESQQFWSTRRESLAIFAHSKFFKFFRLPDQQIPRMLNIQRHFNVEPLSQLLDDNLSYVVLTLGHNNVSLYKANRFDIKPIKLKGFPADMHETLRIDELPRVLELHPVAAAERRNPKRGIGSHTFHGQYNVSQTDKTMLLQFFRQINKRLSEFLQGKQIPMVLAGANYLLPIYRMVNTYPHLAPAGVTGSNVASSPESIRKKAYNIVRHVQSYRITKSRRYSRNKKALK